MNKPTLHHYVPQFYLRRFRDASDRLWAWDRDSGRVFPTTPRSVAAENSFYHLEYLAGRGHDPLTMEKQFAALEREVALITAEWLSLIRGGEPGHEIPIPDVNHDLVSLFLGLQFLRTADTREILAALASSPSDAPLSESERRMLQVEALWDDAFVNLLSERVRSAIWVFGRNATAVPLITSDNPVAFRSSDNAMWLRAGVLGAGVYIVYPLAPDAVMYCHPREEPWLGLEGFDCSISPIPFTAEMVESENSGQVFMASRFVFSCSQDFSAARDLETTIGTDTYADKSRARGEQDS